MPAWKLGCGLENRLAGINAKLEQPDLPPHKKEALLNRKQMLEAKLEQQKNGETPMKNGRGAHLENRLAWITAKLSQPDLPKEKVEKLTARKQFLEAQLQQADATPQDATACHFNHNLESRLAWIRTKLEQPDLPPHKVEKLTRRLEMLEAKAEEQKACAPTDAPQGRWTGRLEAKLAMVDAQLADPNLPEHKREKLLASKEWIQTKLQAKQTGCAADGPTMMPGMHPRPMKHWGPHPMMHPPMYHPPPHGHPSGPHHGPHGHPHAQNGPHAHPAAHGHHRGGFCRK